MKSIKIFVILILLPLSIYAKTVRGFVIDETKTPVSFANVLLLSDSTFIVGCVSDSAGWFELNNVNHDANGIKVSTFGYEDKYMTIPDDGNCDTISLVPSATLLKEIFVKGNLPLTKLKDNAFVTRVDNTVLAKMGSANDVLKHIPMISGDDGYYSIFGRGNATIYINGKIVRNPDEIGQLSSGDIKEIQVISNPGAQYGSHIKAVIRIITKKNTNEGFSISAYSDNHYNQRFTSKNQVDLKYKKNGWELFSFGYLDQCGYYWDDFQRAISTRSNSMLEMTTQTHAKKDKTGVQGKIGVNYQFNENNSVGAYYKQEYVSGRTSGQLSNQIITNQHISNSTADLKTNIKPMPTNSANIYYHGEVGRFIVDLNGDWMLVGNRDESSLFEQDELTGNRNITTFNTERKRLLAENINVSYRFFKGNVSLGEEYTNSLSRNNFRNPENIITSALSLVEDSNASAFAQLSQSVGDFSFTTGVRYERLYTKCYLNNTLLEGQSTAYNQFLPSANVTFSHENLNVALSFRKRVERPRYDLLSGNYSYVNSMLLQRGNPFLKPVKYQDFNAEASWKFINISAQFTNQRNVIIQVYEKYNEDKNINLSTFVNMPKLKRFSFIFNATPTFGLYQPALYLGVYQQWFHILYNDVDKKMNRPIFITQFDNILTLPHNWMVESSLWWRSKGDWDNTYYPHAETKFDLRITKSFLKKSLDITLSLNDIFNGSIYYGDLYSGYIKTQNINNSYSRSVALTFRYKLNTSKSSYKGEGSGLSEKERF